MINCLKQDPTAFNLVNDAQIFKTAIEAKNTELPCDCEE